MALRYGRYEVLYKLGQGAMAQVFLAKDPVLSRFVAVKVLHADLASRQDVLHRFFNEARTVAVIRNPHVVEVFDFGQEGKDLYLVMEFVDGLSLHGLMRRGPAPRPSEAEPDLWPAPGGEGAPGYGPMDPVLAAALICQAAEGLSIAADHGVVHRDLKPENLMLNTQGYLKISDFGIAHVQDDSLTKTGAVIGSPLYMSPEQARGLKPITSQSDMFSLGAVFYACLAGHPPFQGRTVTELFKRISVEPHLSLRRLRPDLDPALSNLVDTLLQKQPSARGGGPRWLHRQLKACLSAAGAGDPAELAAAHLREVNARGLQTTWKIDARNGTLPLTVAATQRATVRARPGEDFPRASLPSAALSAESAPRRAGEGLTRRTARSRARILACMGLGMGLLAGGWGIAAKIRGPGGTYPHGRAQGSLQVTVTGESPRSPAEASPASRTPSRNPAEGTGIPDERAPIAVDPHPSGGSTASGREGPGPAGVASPQPPQGSAGQPGAAGEPVTKDNEAMMILKSSPPFAEAYVDGRFLGTTPIRLEHLVPGRHRLGLKSPGLPGLDTTLVFTTGTHALKVRLDAGPGLRMAAIPVEGE